MYLLLNTILDHQLTALAEMDYYSACIDLTIIYSDACTIQLNQYDTHRIVSQI